MLRPNSRSCRTASIRSGIAGGLAGELLTLQGEPFDTRPRPRCHYNDATRWIGHERAARSYSPPPTRFNATMCT